MFSADSIDTTVSTSDEHPNSSLFSSAFESWGLRGNSAIFRPSGVSSPSSSRQSSVYRRSMALTSDCVDGGSMKSKWMRSLIPIALSCSTTLSRLARWISGIEFGSISFWYALSVYRRKHTPGPVRPARPARWLAESWEIGVTTRESICDLGL